MTNCEYCGAPSKAIDQERERIKKVLLGSPPKLRMDIDLYINGVFSHHLETFRDVERWTRFYVHLPVGEMDGNLIPLPSREAKIVISLIPEQERDPQ